MPFWLFLTFLTAPFKSSLSLIGFISNHNDDQRFINHSLLYTIDASLKDRNTSLQWGIVLDHRPVRSNGPVSTGLPGGVVPHEATCHVLAADRL